VALAGARKPPMNETAGNEQPYQRAPKVPRHDPVKDF
jgi:hypothetical protein